MTLFRRKVNDLQEKHNLDIYITLVLAFTVTALAIFQVTDQSVLSAAILATLALVSLSLLKNRRETEEVAKTLHGMRDMQRQMDAIVSSMGITFAFIPVSEGRFSDSSRMIRELAMKASKEVLVLDFNPLADKESKVRYHKQEKTSEARQKYYESLIEKVKNSKAGEFRYRRLVQIPPGRHIHELVADDEIFRAHCEALVSLGEKQPEIASLRVCAPFQERTSFIIDRRHLILEWIMLDPADRYYSGGGYLIFDDPAGNLIVSFLRFFERADANANLVKLSDLSAAGNQS
ncbi:MAG: hypothetical protein JXB25_05400 [Deltaproteobacteria bacterium]|nr:hypothetical protein [Deltaproteobacteria bacterium]